MLLARLKVFLSSLVTQKWLEQIKRQVCFSWILAINRSKQKRDLPYLELVLMTHQCCNKVRSIFLKLVQQMFRFRLRKDNTIFYLCSFLTYFATYILVMGWVIIIIIFLKRSRSSSQFLEWSMSAARARWCLQNMLCYPKCPKLWIDEMMKFSFTCPQSQDFLLGS